MLLRGSFLNKEQTLPLPTILLGTHRYAIFPGKGDKWPLEWLQIVSELASDSIGEQTLQDLVRVKQFKEHDLTHVCCQTGGSSRVEDDDIYEILDEQSHGIQELEEMMERYSEGRRGNLEEGWIEQLARSDVIRGGDKAFINDLRNADYGGFESWCTYKVDSGQDCFRVISRTPSPLYIPGQINMQDYFIWLEYYCNHRADFSTSTSIDEDWYHTRKFWATRLETALEAAST